MRSLVIGTNTKLGEVYFGFKTTDKINHIYQEIPERADSLTNLLLKKTKFLWTSDKLE